MVKNQLNYNKKNMLPQDLLKILLNAYIKNKTTALMYDDIKTIKKINFIFNKLKKNQKEEYFKEIINILKYIQEQVDSLYTILPIFHYLIALPYQKTVEEMIKLLEGD